MLRRAALAVIASIAVAVPLHAQQQATVKRNVNLRPTPSTAQAEIRTLQPPELLTGLDANPIQGYYNVRTSQGEEGFVWGRNITLGSLIAPMVAPLSPASEFAFHLSTCPPTGKAKDANGVLRKLSATNAGLRNIAKRFVPGAVTPRTLTLADFETLQADIDRAFTNAAAHKTKFEPTRDALADLALPTGTVSEGALVQFAGFVIDAKDEHPESVNCAGQDGKDIHISLGNRTTTEWHGFVAEMIPQIPRPVGWERATLVRLKTTPKPQVLVIGALTYDNEHLVNKNSAHPNGTQPKRVSLWEIHPITEFLVCETATCDPLHKNEWTPLDVWRTKHPPH
jgi:hypothetical protein